MRARELDARGEIVAAAAAYEAALAEGVDELPVYLDLAILYWLATDFGHAAAHQLDDAFVERAGRRFGELLDLAAERFDDDGEIEFWRYYVAFVSYGEPPDPELCRRILEMGTTSTPAFHLASLATTPELESSLAVLDRWAADGATERKRFVRSALQGLRASRRPRARSPDR